MIRSLYRKLHRAVNHPNAVKRELRFLAVRQFVAPTGDEIAFLERDWDVLVILDSCRFDLFDRNNPFDTPAELVHSNASHTWEFLQKNFGDGEFTDLVYVTASPQLIRSGARFVHVEHVWRTHWSERYRTVLPEDVTDVALEVAEEYPEKRLVVHYMQPHYPFIGATGRRLPTYSTFDRFSPQVDEDRATIWELLESGAVDAETVWTAYEENLRLALPAVERFTAEVEGKVVVTSDHGNLFGKRVCWLPVRIYGHPAGIPDPELTAVPWVELPYDSRRGRTESDVAADVEMDESEVREKLAALGYA